MSRIESLLNVMRNGIIKKLTNNIQIITDKFVEEIDHILKLKQEEIMKV